MTAGTVYLAEVDTYLPAVVTAGVSPGHGTSPRGVLPVSVTAASGTIYGSDTGYRSRSTDAGGVVSYPPIIEQAFAIDRRINLDPGASAAAAAWGTISLNNTDGRFDSLVAAQNSDGREVRIYFGTKAYDLARGYWIDPTKASLTTAFKGIAQPWTLGIETLDIPLRDATYWLERPISSSLYTGAGGLNGGADLTGKPLPKARGGTSTYPIRNVAPVLVDATALIYQYSDGPGTVQALYEGADPNIVFDSNTTNLYVGSTPSGKYRTDNSRGLFQLGSTAVRQITVDVTGQFPTAGVQTTAFAIARYLLTEDAALPASYLDTSAFATLDAAYPYASGLWIGPDDQVDGATAAAFVIGGFGAKLFPKIDGTLSAFALRAPSGTPAISLNTATVISVMPRDLPKMLYPPPFRIRVGYQRAWAVQTSGLSPLATAARQSFVANQWRVNGASSTAILTAYRRPNDPAVIGGGLLNGADATTAATDMLALWATRRRLYDVTIPVLTGLTLDLGNLISLAFPLDNLRNGALGVIVGAQLRSQDSTITFQVLV